MALVIKINEDKEFLNKDYEGHHHYNAHADYDKHHQNDGKIKLKTSKDLKNERERDGFKHQNQQVSSGTLTIVAVSAKLER